MIGPASSTVSATPQAGAAIAGVVGAAPPRSERYLRRANMLLVVAVSLAAAWFAWTLLAPAAAAAPGSGITAVSVAGGAAPTPTPINLRKAFTGRSSLFAPAVPVAAGPGVQEVLARAKARLTLKAINRPFGSDRLAAYFVVADETPAGRPTAPPARPGLPGARPPRPAHRGMQPYFEGDRVGDFTVKTVEPRSVVLTLADQEVTFSL